MTGYSKSLGGAVAQINRSAVTDRMCRTYALEENVQ